jgi:hypothetical protein
MTEPSDETPEGERYTLFVTDAELIRRLGVPEKVARPAIHMLDDKKGTGFPKKNPLWGNRRYWPAVVAYFDATYGLRVIDHRSRGPENFGPIPPRRQP